MAISWNMVTITITTHDAGSKVTDKDRKLAAAIDAMGDGVTDAHPNVTRVADAAAEFGLTIEPLRLPRRNKTAADAAAAIGVDVGQIVKSLIFAVDGEVVLAYVSGANQLDEKKLADAAGGSKLRSGRRRHRARGDRLPDRRRPTVRPRDDAAVFIDPDLLQYDEVWAAAGTWHDVFASSPARPRTGQRRHRHRPEAMIRCLAGGTTECGLGLAHLDFLIASA